MAHQLCHLPVGGAWLIRQVDRHTLAMQQRTCVAQTRTADTLAAVTLPTLLAGGAVGRTEAAFADTARRIADRADVILAEVAFLAVLGAEQVVTDFCAQRVLAAKALFAEIADKPARFTARFTTRSARSCPWRPCLAARALHQTVGTIDPASV